MDKKDGEEDGGEGKRLNGRTFAVVRANQFYNLFEMAEKS